MPKYLDPLLCGGHCDNIKPPECNVDESNDSIRQKATLGHVEVRVGSPSKDDKEADIIAS